MWPLRLLDSSKSKVKSPSPSGLAAFLRPDPRHLGPGHFHFARFRHRRNFATKKNDAVPSSKLQAAQKPRNVAAPGSSVKRPEPCYQMNSH